jgi:hypothetical protein
MALNPGFNNYNFANTQNLFNNLVIEAIQSKGFEINYMPRDIINYDEIFGEGDQYKFANNYIIEVYMTNVEQWGGQGDIFSKFGVEITDQATLIVSRTRFTEEIGDVRTMPREGDLIYVPFSKSFLQIMKMEYDSPFWPQGANYVYEMKCELFSFANEELDTANTTIQDEISIFEGDANTAFMPFDNDQLTSEQSDLIDYTEENPYGFQ